MTLFPSYRASIIIKNHLKCRQVITPIIQGTIMPNICFPFTPNCLKHVVTCLILEIKGDLIRQPVMDILLNYTIGLKNPVLFVFLNQVDKWMANLLLAVCLVYLCPQKKEQK